VETSGIVTMMTANARFWMIAVLVGGVLIYLLAPVLTPFVVAALLAYLGDPLVDRLERGRIGRWRVGRTGAVALVFLLMTLVLVMAVLLLIPMLEKQVSRLISELPRYLAWFQDEALPWVTTRLGIETPSLESDELVAMLREHWQSAGGVAATVLAGVSKSGMAVIGWLLNLVLIPVVAFYLLRDWDVLMETIRGMLPRSSEPTVSKLARESDEVLGAFLRGQLLVMLALATMYSIGLTLLGVDLALLIGLIAGLISFVPYLGTIVGMGAAIIASLVQYGEWWHFVGVLAVFSVGQTIEGFVLQPWLIGDRIGLHPVAVIFAVMAGGQLFGFLGILLALPIAAVLVVVLRHFYARYRESHVYADSGSAVVVPDGIVVVDGRSVSSESGKPRVVVASDSVDPARR
jgi:predicted PurR-regulated permease PerM